MVFTESYNYILKNVTNALTKIDLEKIRKTINKLTKICGSDGFHYLMTDEPFDEEEEKNDPRML